jgi:hypothetical protein
MELRILDHNQSILPYAFPGFLYTTSEYTSIIILSEELAFKDLILACPMSWHLSYLKLMVLMV